MFLNGVGKAAGICSRHAVPISLGGKICHKFSIVVVRHVFDDEYTFLANAIETRCAGDRRLINVACQRRVM